MQLNTIRTCLGKHEYDKAIGLIDEGLASGQVNTDQLLEIMIACVVNEGTEVLDHVIKNKGDKILKTHQKVKDGVSVSVEDVFLGACEFDDLGCIEVLNKWSGFKKSLFLIRQGALLVGSMGSLKTLKYVLKMDSGVLNDNVGAKVLKAAIFNDNLQMVEFLIKKGVPLQSKSPFGNINCLTTAAIRGNIQMLESLVNAGADVNFDPYGLMVSAVKGGSGLEVINWAKSKGVEEIEVDLELLKEAVDNDDYDIVNDLMKLPCKLTKEDIEACSQVNWHANNGVGSDNRGAVKAVSGVIDVMIDQMVKQKGDLSFILNINDTWWDQASCKEFCLGHKLSKDIYNDVLKKIKENPEMSVPAGISAFIKDFEQYACLKKMIETKPVDTSVKKDVEKKRRMHL